MNRAFLVLNSHFAARGSYHIPQFPFYPRPLGFTSLQSNPMHLGTAMITSPSQLAFRQRCRCQLASTLGYDPSKQKLRPFSSPPGSIFSAESKDQLDHHGTRDGSRKPYIIFKIFFTSFLHLYQPIN